MKILGLIGGLSWISTIDYYRMINQAVGEHLGGLHSAKINLNSVDFHEFYNLVKQDKWANVADMLSQAAVKLQRSGAKAIVICANTPHIVADQVQQSITISLIHIATVTADEILKATYPNHWANWDETHYGRAILPRKTGGKTN